MPNSLIPIKNLTSAIVCQELCEYLSTNILAKGVLINENVPLKEVGVDSVALMDLVLFMERQYNFLFPLEMLTPENTASVSSLSQCLQKI
jgi:acyl carrier protein